MKKFMQFFSRCNDIEFTFPGSKELKEDLLAECTDMYRSALNDNYINDKEYASGVFGGSQMGKPSIVTAWDYYFKPQYPTATIGDKRKWFGGHLFEIEVYYFARRLGYVDICRQMDVTVSQFIKGHPDLVVKDGEYGPFIIECKHVAGTRYRHYLKHGMDNQQYQTQLALYATALNCDAIWCISNAETGEQFCIPLPLAQAEKLYGELVLRAHTITALCAQSNSLVEVLQKGICPPKPRRRKDGTWYIPPGMYVKKGVLHPSCNLYNFYTKDDKHFVTGLNYPEEARGYEPDWAEELS